ncbi:MAG: helix-turn-helix domain-containing protein [Gammaproteobacteria bacterium]
MADAPADKTPSAPSLGAELRSARERRGLSVHQAAQDLHVDDGLIEALERDDYSALGAPIFVHGHLRNYAQLLGLHADEVLAAYDHAGKKLSTPRLVTLKPAGNLRARRAGLQVFSLLVIAVLVVLAVIWWRHRAPVPAPEVAAQSAAHGPRVIRPVELASAAASAHTQSVPLPMPAGAAGAATPASTAGGRVVRAQFTVTQTSWIEVYDASGKRLFYNLAPTGDKLSLSGAGPLQVFLGNAPGVSIELNGAPFTFKQFLQPNDTARFSLGAAAPGSGQPR